MKKLAVILCALATLAWGMPKDLIEPTLKTDLESAMKILDSNAELNVKSYELFSIFDKYFDYKLMAKLSLSKLYKGLSEPEQKKFCELFEARVKQSFSEKLALYSGQRVKITGSENPTVNRYFVNAELKAAPNEAGESYKLLFKFYRANETGEFFIYDIDIIGVSLIQTYRAQFEDLGARAGFEEIEKRLQSSNIPNPNEIKTVNDK